MNVAVVGAGRWGSRYLDTFQKIGVKVPLVCSRTLQTAKKAVAASKIKPLICTDFNEVLKSNVDAVAIVTNASIHYELAKKALLAGMHVIVEKPLAFDPKEVDELFKLAKNKKLVLFVSDVHSFNPAIAKVSKDAKAGFFGKPMLFSMVHEGNGPIRTDMGVIWDYMPHSVSIMLHFLGKPRFVFASGKIKGKLEEAARVDIDFGKSYGTSFATWLAQKKRMEFTVAGKKASAHYDDVKKELVYFSAKKQKKIKLGTDLPLTSQLLYFSKSVKTRKVQNGKRQVLITSILRAAHNSLRTGKIVKV